MIFCLKTFSASKYIQGKDHEHAELHWELSTIISVAELHIFVLFLASTLSETSSVFLENCNIENLTE